jgi:type I restriction-modification system DNA methylase subunit
VDLIDKEQWSSLSADVKGDAYEGLLQKNAEDVKRRDAASTASTFELPVITKDALAGKHGEYEIVLANPPFGKKSSVTIVNEAGESSKESLVINRDELPLLRLCG